MLIALAELWNQVKNYTLNENVMSKPIKFKLMILTLCGTVLFAGHRFIPHMTRVPTPMPRC